ncbi:unnamed protein product, partial [Polarella glacialis]
ELETMAEADVAEAEASLSSAQKALAEREESLAKLSAQKATAEQAAQNLRKLEGLGSVAPTRPRRQEPLKAAAAAAVEVELEVSGTLAAVEQKLARLGVPFDVGSSTLLEGNAAQALALPRIADVLKEHRGKLKLQLEGHRDESEPQGLDLERSLAVYQWLVEIAGCSPGMLRLKGRAARAGNGRFAVPVPIQELVLRKGPLPPEQQQLGSCPFGIYFSE